MSDTPETDAIVRNAATADHPPTRLAAMLTVKCEKLERERDEARELLASEKITRNHIIQRGIEMQKERDEAREYLERQRLEIVRLNGATNHAGGTPLKIALRERDEAREAWYEMQSSFERSRDEVEKLIRERDEARKEAEYYKARYEQLKEEAK